MTIEDNKALTKKKDSKKQQTLAVAKDSHRITERYEILDGAVDIIRTTKSGKFWTMSCWLKNERKCYRRSLRTKNLEEAKEIARDEYFKIQGNIRSGNIIFSKTAEELIKEFIAFKKSEANAGLITQGRVSTITTILNKWVLPYIGKTKKINNLNRHSFEEYFVWRRKQADDVRAITLINERALISSMYKYGISRGLLRHDQAPIFPRMNIKKSQVDRRDELELHEWEQMFRSFRRWVSKAEDEHDEVNRKFIRDFIIIAANTGLRFGELHKLKWSMIEIRNDITTTNKKEPTCIIKVPPDTKTGARTTTGRRGDIFQRIRGYSKHTKHNDYVFVDNKTGAPLDRKVYYKLWHLLMTECGLSESTKKLSYYSLRHTYITFRLLAGVNVFILAENVGTSVKMIENHYAHIKSDSVRRELTKDMKKDEAGQILLG